MTGPVLRPLEIGAFASVAPLLTASQEDTLTWLASAHAMAARLAGGETDSYDTLVERMQQRLRRFGCKPAQIGTRGYDTFDVRRHDFAKSGLYALGENAQTGAMAGPNAAPLGERSAFYSARAQQVFREFYPVDQDRPATLEAPAHLVHVTCTGYVSPSAAQLLVDQRGWHEQTAVTHAYHMGCYAAFPALRMAEGLSRTQTWAGPDRRPVDLVHTELCTLHLNPANASPEQLVVHSLFADGHIKYALRPPGSFKRGFRLLRVMEQIIPDSAADMTWTPDHWGFRMSLSREVPRKIGGAIRAFVKRLAEASGCPLGLLLKEAQFAIHPGGPKIIDSVQELLELRPEQTAASTKVLFERGNMSSATLPHVWMALEAASLPRDSHVVSLAFGPGLTIFGAVFSVL